MNNKKNKQLNTVMHLVQETEKKMHTNNPDKLEQMDLCEYLLREATEEGRVTTVINSPFKSMGYVSVEGKEITITAPDLLIFAAGLASNVDIYTKTDGTIRFDFTFHGIASPSKGERR